MSFYDDKKLFSEWYAENKFVLWGMHLCIAIVILTSTISGEFILSLWQFLAYVWFMRAMEGFYLSFRALKLLDAVLKVNK